MKTLNRTLAIGAAITAAAILVPAAAFAQGPHGAPPPRPNNGVQLAADIVNLVRTVIEPRPAPVFVAPRERAVTTRVVTATPVVTTTSATVVTTPATVVTTPATVVTTTPVVTTPATVVTAPATVVTTTPGTVVVTGATTIPEYSYSFFYGEYVPYFEGWFFYANDWIWGGIGPRPPVPPRWIPPRREPHHIVIGRPERWIGIDPAPLRRRTESARTVVVPPQEKKSEFPVIPSQHRVPRKSDR